MYHVIGLKETGEMVLFGDFHTPPSIETLARETKGFDYTQLLVVSDDAQLARYEFEEAPRLKQVPLA